MLRKLDIYFGYFIVVINVFSLCCENRISGLFIAGKNRFKRIKKKLPWLNYSMQKFIMNQMAIITIFLMTNIMDSPAISLSSSLYTTIKSVTHENHSAKLDDQENKKLENFCSKILSNKSRLQSVSIETFDESNWQKKHRHILTVILNNRLYRIPLDNIEYTTRKNFHVAKLNLTFVNVNNDGDHNQPHKSCNPKWYNVTDFMLDADQMPSDGIHRLQLLNIFHYNGKRYQHYFFHPNSSSNDDESKSVLLINGKIHSISNKPGYFPFFDNDYIYHSIDHDGFNGGRNKWKSLGYFLFKSRDKQSGQNITRIQSIYLNKNYG